MSTDRSVRIIPATLDDAPSIRALVRASYAKWVPLIGREPLPMAADYERAIQDHAIDLLYVGRDLAGLIETIMRPDHLFVENVAVATAYQGRGFGSSLMLHAERRARDAGRDGIRLLTNAAFVVNVELYRSLGYRVDREEPFLNGVTVHMSKRLETA